MCAREHVYEKAFGEFELPLLQADSSELLVDDRASMWLLAVQDQSNVRQADADFLTGAQDAEASYMFSAVVAMAGREAIGDHHTDVVPVPEYMGRDIEQLRSFTDLHPPMIAS